LTLAAAMLAGRFLVVVPVLCIAGMLVAKGRVPPAMGTLPTHGPFFVAVMIVGGLTFFPALALGPFVEHLAMAKGMLYASP
jgi:potassium-transporting ATPase potassium-binding subunit